jgi:HD-like signal output (HDOD) protein
VKSLVLSAKIFAQFDTRRIGGFSMEELWRHSLETGRCARVVGIAEKMPRLALEDAFTAGILHDLGKPILAQNFPETYPGVLARAQEQGRAVRDLEVECFGACHAKLAAYLMGLWGVGEGVVDAIAFHHRPSESPSEALAIGAVHAANAIAHRLSGVTGEGQAEDVGLDLDYLARGDRLERLPVWQEACRSVRPEEGGTC